MDKPVKPMNPLLRMAVLAGVETAVRLHIRRGDSLDARDGGGATPLMLAAGRRNNVRFVALSSKARSWLAAITAQPPGKAARMRSRYSSAWCSRTTGGFRLGMTMARANCLAVQGSASRIAAPSRKCR